ncbi:MAG: Fic family protein [Candidatus Woesearchaeota archaeon]
MAYLYKKQINGKVYYYLRISKRVDGKLVVNDVAYLGSNITEVEKKLEQLEKYQKEIRKGYHNIRKFIESDYYLEKIKEKKLKKNEYIKPEQLNKIEAIKLHYSQHFLKQDKLTLSETYNHFLIDFAYNTTSIEGNTITLEEAQKLLEEDILPKDKTLREVYDLQNTEKVFFKLLEEMPLINEKLIVDIHDLLLDKIDVRRGYRNNEIRVFKSRFNASPVKYIKTDMGLLMKWLKENRNKLHPLVLAGLFHHKFEMIHPFSDGNGRTGRMIMNYILIKKGYPPFIVSKKRRNDYLKAMSSADKADLKNIKPKYYKVLTNYLAEEMIASYWNNFNI